MRHLKEVMLLLIGNDGPLRRRTSITNSSVNG